MRVFVAGATGVIGRRTIPLMLEAGHQVTAAGRSAPRLEELRRAGATVVALDLFDRVAVGKALDGRATAWAPASRTAREGWRGVLPPAPA